MIFLNGLIKSIGLNIRYDNGCCTHKMRPTPIRYHQAIKLHVSVGENGPSPRDFIH